MGCWRRGCCADGCCFVGGQALVDVSSGVAFILIAAVFEGEDSTQGRCYAV